MNKLVKIFSFFLFIALFCFTSAFAAKPSDQDASPPKKPLINSGTGGPQLVLPNANQSEGNKSRYPVDGVARSVVDEARVSSPPPQYVCTNFVYQGPTVIAQRKGGNGSLLFGLCPIGYHCTDRQTGKCEWQHGVLGIVYGTPGRLPGNYTCPPWNDELRDCSPGILIY